MKKCTIGYVISILFFATSVITLEATVQGNVAWLLMLILALMAAILTSALLPRSMHNTRSLYAGVASMFVAVALAFDMHDEMANEYGGGFGGGNGFLLDGVETMLYMGAIPALFILGLILLTMNSRAKLRNKTNV